MDDLIQRYYEAEMRYLYESGKEFAKVHPDRAGMLNLDHVTDRDPYVERLFEGFAFLMGRLRQKIDDDFPELTENLVSLLWPHYLRFIPSLSIVELTPNVNTLSRLEVIKKGLEVKTVPLGVEHVSCRYQTTTDVKLQPILIDDVVLEVQSDGNSSLIIKFAFTKLADFTQMNLSLLKLYLNAEVPVASTLYHFMTQQISNIFIRFSNDLEQQIKFNGSIKASGFNDDDRLWLKPDNAFSGYQLLLEYFAFREKFMFLELQGLELDNFPKDCEYFEIKILFNKIWPFKMPLSKDNIKLHCVPVINLFSMEADPITVNQLESEYFLQPLLKGDSNIEIYSVDHVEAITEKGRFQYVPFTSFKHRGGMLRHEAPERYYHTKVRQGASGIHETWLILGGRKWQTTDELEPEILSLRVTGTNGMLPRKYLRNAKINCLEKQNINIAKVINLCAPTVPCYPPTNDRFQWRILSHLAPNYLSLMNAEVLRGTLALYDWTDNLLNKRRLEGIIDVKHKLTQRIERGFLQKGVLIEITVNSDKYSSDGDLLLFGELLHNFFALYADANLFTKLIIISLPSGKKIEWKTSKTDLITI